LLSTVRASLIAGFIVVSLFPFVAMRFTST
jgi:hypothetical protein